MTKLIIDADTGSDDAVALLMAYRNLPEDKILGITVVAGNVPLEQGLINTCLLYTSPSPRDISGSRMPSSA